VIYVISYIETGVCSQTMYFLIYKKWVCPHTTFENQIYVHIYFINLKYEKCPIVCEISIWE
jgi:hypothetical protein